MSKGSDIVAEYTNKVKGADLLLAILANDDVATYDEIAFSQTTLTDVFATKLATVLVKTYTLTYTDASKLVPLKIVRS